MLRLGSQTGSLINHLDSRAVRGQPMPVVGMGATVLCWTDRHAATIVDIIEKGQWLYVWVQEDEAVRLDQHGWSESQDYGYVLNSKGNKHLFRRPLNNQDGFWLNCKVNQQTGRFNAERCGYGLKIGLRDEYYDYSF